MNLMLGGGNQKIFNRSAVADLKMRMAQIGASSIKYKKQDVHAIDSDQIDALAEQKNKQCDRKRLHDRSAQRKQDAFDRMGTVNGKWRQPFSGMMGLVKCPKQGDPMQRKMNNKS